LLLRCRMFSKLPVERSSMTKTSSPRSSIASERCDPMNPAPPVMRTRMNGEERSTSAAQEALVQPADVAHQALLGIVPVHEFAASFGVARTELRMFRQVGHHDPERPQVAVRQGQPAAVGK